MVLESSLGSTNVLLEIPSSPKLKSKTKEDIQVSISQWLNNSHFDSFRNEKLDLSLVIYCNKSRYGRQDLDNIAKIVLDSLKRQKDLITLSLFNDDSQITRLLLYKLERDAHEIYQTDILIISFRKHNPLKQMILLPQKRI